MRKVTGPQSSEDNLENEKICYFFSSLEMKDNYYYLFTKKQQPFRIRFMLSPLKLNDLKGINEN